MPGRRTTGLGGRRGGPVDALDDYDRKAEAARQRCFNIKRLRIEYFMYLRRIGRDHPGPGYGTFRWQVKRHLKPEIFRNSIRR